LYGLGGEILSDTGNCSSHTGPGNSAIGTERPLSHWNFRNHDGNCFFPTGFSSFPAEVASPVWKIWLVRGFPRVQERKTDSMTAFRNPRQKLFFRLRPGQIRAGKYFSMGIRETQ